MVSSVVAPAPAGVPDGRWPRLSRCRVPIRAQFDRSGSGATPAVPNPSERQGSGESASSSVSRSRTRPGRPGLPNPALGRSRRRRQAAAPVDLTGRGHPLNSGRSRAPEHCAGATTSTYDFNPWVERRTCQRSTPQDSTASLSSLSVSGVASSPSTRKATSSRRRASSLIASSTHATCASDRPLSDR